MSFEARSWVNKFLLASTPPPNGWPTIVSIRSTATYTSDGMTMTWLDACSQPARKESLEEHHTAMGTHHLNIISFRMSSAAQNFYRAHLFLIFSPLPSNNFLYFFIQTFFFRLLPTTTTAAGLLWSPSMSLTMFYRTCSVLGVWGSVDVSFPIIYCDCKINNKTLFIRLQTIKL